MQNNIQNLSSLWSSTLLGKTVDGLNVVYQKGLKWPNRIWSDKPNYNFDTKKLIHLLNVYEGATFSAFGDHLPSLPGLTLKSIQFGMGMSNIGTSNKTLDTNMHISFERVTTLEHCKDWSDLFLKGMGYHIDKDIISKIKLETQFYLLKHEDEYIGTIVLHGSIESNTIGLHSLSILPKMRRKGFGKAVTEHAINESINQGATYICLQASEKAQNIYSALGFQHEFYMYNFQLK